MTETAPAAGCGDVGRVVAEAGALLGEGRAEDALRLLDANLAGATQDPRLSHVTGRALLAVGRNVEAIGKLADAADQDPEHVGFALDLGDAVLRVGLNEQALVIARRAIELDPQSVDAFLLLASAQEALGEKDDALEALRRAVSLARNPLPEPVDPLQQPLRPPLHVGTGSLLFMDFEARGGIADLRLLSRSGAATLIVKVGEAASMDLDGPARERSEGVLPRERLLRSLPEALAAKVELFEAETFSYVVHGATS